MQGEQLVYQHAHSLQITPKLHPASSCELLHTGDSEQQLADCRFPALRQSGYLQGEGRKSRVGEVQSQVQPLTCARIPWPSADVQLRLAVSSPAHTPPPRHLLTATPAPTHTHTHTQSRGVFPIFFTFSTSSHLPAKGGGQGLLSTAPAEVGLHSTPAATSAEHTPSSLLHASTP